MSIDRCWSGRGQRRERREELPPKRDDEDCLKWVGGAPNTLQGQRMAREIQGVRAEVDATLNSWIPASDGSSVQSIDDGRGRIADQRAMASSISGERHGLVP